MRVNVTNGLHLRSIHLNTRIEIQSSNIWNCLFKGEYGVSLIDWICEVTSLTESKSYIEISGGLESGKVVEVRPSSGKSGGDRDRNSSLVNCTDFDFGIWGLVTPYLSFDTLLLALFACVDGS